MGRVLLGGWRHYGVIRMGHRRLRVNEHVESEVGTCTAEELRNCIVSDHVIKSDSHIGSIRGRAALLPLSRKDQTKNMGGLS